MFWITLIFLILLPTALAVFLMFGNVRSFPLQLALALLLVMGTLYSAYATGWFFFGYWTLAGIAGLTVSAVAATIIRSFRAPMRFESRAEVYLFVLSCVSSLALAYANLTSARDLLTSEPVVALQFPLRDGVYAVRRHASHPAPSQRLAADLVKIGAGGHASKSYLGGHEADLIIGEPVYAPCSGSVVWARDGIEDRLGRDEETPAGNALVLNCERTLVYLAHLQKHSVLVESDDMVQAGMQLGKIGTSGNTTIPHLHIHAEQGTFQGELYSDGNVAVGMRFEGGLPWKNKLYWR